MAGFEDVTKKAQEFLKDNKLKDALHSDRAEEVSDSILDSVANAAKKVTGGKFDDKIDKARDDADKKFGTN